MYGTSFFSNKSKKLFDSNRQACPPGYSRGSSQVRHWPPQGHLGTAPGDIHARGKRGPLFRLANQLRKGSNITENIFYEQENAGVSVT